MNKTFLFCFFLSIALTGCTSMPLSPQAKKESRLFMHVLAASYAQRQTPPNALPFFQKALELAPNSVFLKRQALTAALTENREELAPMYADFLTKDSDATDYAIHAAYEWKTGNIKQALEEYEKALQLSPDDGRILYQYVLLLLHANPDKAIEKLEAQIPNYPSLAPSIYAEIGHIYLRRQNEAEALAYYNKSTALNPLFEPPYLGRAEVYEKQSKYFLMLKELEGLEKLGYESPAVYARMASVFFLSKDMDKAEKYFLKAKQIDPKDAVSAYFLAGFAERRGEYQAAIDYLKDASDYQTHSGKWLQVSFYLQRLGKPQESLDVLAEAYTKFNQSVEIGYFYALALQDAKEYKKSARVLEQILNTNSGYDDARQAYAFALDALGKYKEMENSVQILLDKNPQNATALNLIAYSLAQRNTRLLEAQVFITRALGVRPLEPAFLDTQAWIYYRQNRLEDALEVFETLPQDVFTLNAEMAYHRGAVLVALGRGEEARPYLQFAAGEITEAAKLYKKIL